MYNAYVQFLEIVLHCFRKKAINTLKYSNMFGLNQQ